MALNGKYISLKSIMEQVYADNGYQFELPWTDCMQWTEEALNLIGHPRQYIRKVTGHKDNPDLDIKDYRAHLPCDFYQLEQVAVNGMAAEYSGNTFHHLLGGDCCGVGEDSSSSLYYSNDQTITRNWGTDVLTYNEETQSYSYEARDLTDMENLNLQSDSTQNFTLANGSEYNQSNNITFDLNNDHITLSAKEGKVCMAYLAIPTDEEGLPLIPDNTSYQLAVKKYLTMKIDYIAWRKGELRADIFQHSEQEWAWYVGQAGNKAKMPNLDQMESIKNQVMRLLPNVNHHETFFRTLGSPEIRKNFNR
tara:strand:- start:265 stop:1185 length:921 start_codon:yes stop_codon:yes gene_type:complete